MCKFLSVQFPASIIFSSSSRSSSGLLVVVVLLRLAGLLIAVALLLVFLVGGQWHTACQHLFVSAGAPVSPFTRGLNACHRHAIHYLINFPLLGLGT